MFTALAFLIFGGISSLDNLFSEMNNLSILKLVTLGCVWGICILNLIFVFLICVSKMTHLPFGFSDKPEVSIREKYAVVWLSNLILLTLLMFSLGVMSIDKYRLIKWFVQWILRCFCSYINHAVWCRIIFYFSQEERLN